MTARAEAFVIFTKGTARPEALGAARASTAGAQIELESRPGRVHLQVSVPGNPQQALEACAMAALALIEAMGDDSAMIEGLRRISSASTAARMVVSRAAKARPRPQILMGEVTSPKPGPDNAREAFRNFMTSRRLRPTIWAKEAGISSGEIMGYLTGRSRGFSPGIAEKLARAAKVTVKDIFAEGEPENPRSRRFSGVDGPKELK